MIPANDTDRELSLLGSMIMWPANTPRVLEVLVPSDFYLPAHQRLFTAIQAVWRSGEKIESSGVIEQLRRLGVHGRVDCYSSIVNSEYNAMPAARVVAAMALRRRLHSVSLELQQAAADLTNDAASVLDSARATLAAIDTPLISREPDDESFDEFLQRSTDKPTSWLVPHVIREGWRTVIVAGEGLGKTWLLRQFAVCAAYGIHPLRFTAMEPVSVMLCDLENPEDHIHASLDRLVGQARRFSSTTPQGRLWHRPGGIDLRKRADRAEMESLIAQRRPQLLIAGPLYKMMRVNANESWEQAAREVQAVLDDWRTRYSLSLLLEDHAPQASGGKREMRPYGSSLWLRWPEIGIGLEKTRDGSLALSRWRGDRMPTDWPTSLSRGNPWPWVGRWDDGMAEE